MADKSNAPKVQQQGAFGQIQTITLDTNRPETVGETLFRAGNAVSFPSHAIYSDALTWILVPAVCLRLIMHFVAFGVLPGAGALAAAAFLLLPPLLIVCYVASQLPKTHTAASLYRLALIAAGMLLAVL
jgi:hypothetical protein